jgi:hypothetical protein
MKEKFKLKWRYFWLILFIYHFIIPVKYFFPHGCCLYAYGFVGTYETFREYPISFFLNPLIIFLMFKIVIFIYYKAKAQ